MDAGCLTVSKDLLGKSWVRVLSHRFFHVIQLLSNFSDIRSERCNSSGAVVFVVIVVLVSSGSGLNVCGLNLALSLAGSSSSLCGRGVRLGLLDYRRLLLDDWGLLDNWDLRLWLWLRNRLGSVFDVFQCGFVGGSSSLSFKLVSGDLL